MKKQALLGIALLLAGCSDGNPGAAVDSAPLAPAVPAAVAPPMGEQPARPDPVFAQAVLEEIDGGLTAAVQHLAQTRVLDERFMAYLNALHTSSWVGLSVREWQELKDVLVDRPGRGVTTVQRIVEWSPGCIVAAVRGDYTAWFPPLQEDPRQRYVALVAGSDPGDRSDLNAIGWQLNYDAWQEDGGEPEDACGA
ncbi:MAG: hypothetical protein ACRD0K_09020 [Egibacteraceae bacterium]